MWRNVLLVLAVLPMIVLAESKLVKKAADIREWRFSEKNMPKTQSFAAASAKALREYRFAEFKPGLTELQELSGDGDAFESVLSWFLLTENFPALEKWVVRTGDWSAIVQGELAFAQLNMERAELMFQTALAFRDPISQRWGSIGLARVFQKKQRYEDAMELLERAWTQELLSDEMIFQAALCKQRLGETSESMDLFEEVLRWNKYHEYGHYYLGNGYARKNYTELESSNKYLKCDGSEICARDFVIDGSEEWMHGEYGAAMEHFFEALKYVPDYGRAHNGVAKCLEQLRLRENLYRDADQAAFDAKEFPEIPMIEKYVLNWESLSARHKKQVAISVEPWKDYLPVLVASASHHYIKPLHEKLSECPGLETIADQRISYDSRLWDDVRGCGGYTTVTGIEDVERSIYNKYNTVLHELTHQVHGVYPPEDWTMIEDLYREASAKDAADEEIFVSRYQGSSVWEYFAEGMNSYFSPRRNEYDTREITKERLHKLDPKLVELLEHYMSAPNVDACYPVAFVNAADNEVELGKLDQAMEFARQAEARDANSEVVLRALARISSYRDQDSLSQAYAERLVQSYPDKAASYGQWASSRAFSDGKYRELLPKLEAGLKKTSSSERTQLIREIAGWQFTCGMFEQAVVNYTLVLAEQSTDDDALRGYAEALLWAGQIGRADSVYQVALKRRSGVVGLRLDYARLLLLTGELDAAKSQIDEAELLKPANGRIAAHRAWWAKLSGKHEESLDHAIVALQQYPDDALVQAIAGYLLSKTDIQTTGVPSWRYNEKESAFEADSFWDAATKALFDNGLTLLSK